MLSHDDFDLVYDNNGNLVNKTNRVTQETTTYDWDTRNRLVGISGPSVTASFTYDALNRRIEKAVNGVTTTFVYDGWDIIQETTGSVTTNYTRTLNIDEPLAFERTDGTIRYYVQDALGSVIALTDAEGLVKTTYSYGAFGNVTVSGEASDNPFQYTGRENDGTGLYYYRVRYYSPEMRRFISEDPIGLAGGINFYSYVGNSPINWSDPFGLAHEGFIINLAKMSSRSLKRTIKSLRKRIAEHKAKPPSKHHDDEIKTFEEQLKLAEEEAAKRGLKDLAGGGAATPIQCKEEDVADDPEEVEDRVDSWFDWLDPFLLPGKAY